MTQPTKREQLAAMRLQAFKEHFKEDELEDLHAGIGSKSEQSLHNLDRAAPDQLVVEDGYDFQSAASSPPFHAMD